MKYIEEVEKLVDKAVKCDEVPVGALIVCNNKILAKSYNKRNKSNNVLMHAEIDVIKKAAKKLKNWRLSECEIYVTLKPCAMCVEIIKASRIKKVHYLIENDKDINRSIEFIKETDNFNIKYKEILSNFFKEKR